MITSQTILVKKISMRKFILITMIFGSFYFTGISQVSTTTAAKPLKLAVVISSNDAETVWNAFRIANYAAGEKDSVSVFLLGKGVEARNIKDKDFDVQEMMATFTENGGKILACGTCMRMREMEGTKQCPVSSLSELYDLIKTCDKILTF